MHLLQPFFGQQKRIEESAFSTRHDGSPDPNSIFSPMGNRKRDPEQHAQDRKHAQHRFCRNLQNPRGSFRGPTTSPEGPREAIGDYVTGACPTAERMRQKAKLKEGHAPKTRKHVVEDHYGDCGSDLARQAPYLLGLPASDDPGNDVD